MMTHDVATGSRCADLRAKTSALGKNALGSPTLRELCSQSAPRQTTASPRSAAWRQMSAPYMWNPSAGSNRSGVSLRTTSSSSSSVATASRELGCFLEGPAAIDNPADALGAQRISLRLEPDGRADAVDARHPDRPEPALGLAELLGEAAVPALGQKDVLMHTDNPLALSPFQAQIEPGAGAGRLVNQNDLVRRTRPNEPRRSQQIGFEDHVIRDANHERDTPAFSAQILSPLPRERVRVRGGGSRARASRTNLRAVVT